MAIVSADALDTKKYEKTESYAAVKQIKDELAKELPADEPDAKKKLSKYYELLREEIFRTQVTKDRIRPRPPVRSTKFVRSPLRPVSCPVPTVQHCSRVVRRKHSSR